MNSLFQVLSSAAIVAAGYIALRILWINARAVLKEDEDA